MFLNVLSYNIQQTHTLYKFNTALSSLLHPPPFIIFFLGQWWLGLQIHFHHNLSYISYIAQMSDNDLVAI